MFRIDQGRAIVESGWPVRDFRVVQTKGGGTLALAAGREEGRQFNPTITRGLWEGS